MYRNIPLWPYEVVTLLGYQFLDCGHRLNLNSSHMCNWTIGSHFLKERSLNVTDM